MTNRDSPDVSRRARAALLTAVAVAVAAAAAACDAPRVGPDAGATDTSVVLDAAVDTMVVGDAPADSRVPAECNPVMGDATPAGSVCIRAVQGTAVGDDGAPLANRPVTVCGAICFAALTDAQGRFLVPVGEVLPFAVYTLQVHGRPAHATAYWPMPAPDADSIARFTAPLEVPRYTAEGPELPESMAITAATSATAGGVTLSLQAGSRVEFDLEDFELMALGRRVRVAEVSIARAPPFAQRGMLRGAVWALAPFAMLSDRPIGVRLPNRAGLPAGSAVEFVAMGREVLGDRPDAAMPVVVARGAVSMDGATVETTTGEGVRALTWIGVRPTTM